MDLFLGFWHIPIRECDRHKTTTCTHIGLFQMKRMAFGLRNAPACFQRLVNTAFMDLLYPRGQGQSSVFTDPTRARLCVYVDDLLAHDRTFEEHLANLEMVFDRLESTGLNAKPSKCSICLPEQPFLGFVVDGDTRRPDPEKVESIKKFPEPLNRTSVQRFLGLTGYYRDFVAD